MAIEFDQGLFDSLRELSELRGVTVSTILLAAWYVTLWQLSRQSDLIVTVPVTGRHRSTTKRLVGYCVNLLPLRIEIREDFSFLDVVRVVDETAREVMRHQDIPFQEVARLTETAQVALAQCVFSFQATPTLEINLAKSTSQYEDVPNGTSNFDLAVFLEQQNHELIGFIDYKSEAFEHESIRSLWECYCTMLRQIVAQQDQPISALAPSDGNDGFAWDSSSSCEGHSLRANHGQLALRASTFGGDERLEQAICRCFEHVLSRDEVHGDDSFFGLGGTSLQAAQLFTELQQEIKPQLPLALLLGAPTPRMLATAIVAGEADAHWSPLVAIQPDGDRPPLYCVHGGGGNVIAYRRLADRLPPNQPVYGLQAKGLQDGVTPLRSIEAMAEIHLEALLGVQPSGTYFLAGHSLGAMVAFEIAQRLSSLGRQVGFLGIIDHTGPGVVLKRTDWLRWQWLALRTLSWQEKWDYFAKGARWRWRSHPWVRKWRGRKALRAAEGESQRKESVRLKLMEASLDALRSYNAKPYPGRLTLFRARYGAPRIHVDPMGGWQGVAVDGVDVYEIEGQHMNLFEPPQIDDLAEKMELSLQQALVSSLAK